MKNAILALLALAGLSVLADTSYEWIMTTDPLVDPAKMTPLEGVTVYLIDADVVNQQSVLTAYNFRLDIPVATAAQEGYVLPNTKIVLEFVDDEGRIFDGVVPENDAIVGEPGGSKKIFTLLAEDSDNNGIADEKEWYYYQYALSIGITLTEFDADADYDGDGQSNRDEYIAGTNPFIAADVFNVRTLNVDFWPKDDAGAQLYDWVKVGFYANNGRCYSLVTTPSLDDGNQWTLGTFKYQPFEDKPSYSRLVTEGEEAGWRWFYIPKDVARRFWRIEVE